MFCPGPHPKKEFQPQTSQVDKPKPLEESFYQAVVQDDLIEEILN